MSMSTFYETAESTLTLMAPDEELGAISSKHVEVIDGYVRISTFTECSEQEMRGILNRLANIATSGRLVVVREWGYGLSVEHPPARYVVTPGNVEIYEYKVLTKEVKG